MNQRPEDMAPRVVIVPSDDPRVLAAWAQALEPRRETVSERRKPAPVMAPPARVG